MPDPALDGATNRASYPAFERTAAELETRISFLLPSSASYDQHRRGGHHMPNDETVNVRYMVDDVDEAIGFYTKLLDFEVLTSAAPAFADVKRGNLRLLLAGTEELRRPADARRRQTRPGGWNRIHFIVDDLDDRGRSAARRRRPLPQRHRRRTRRQQILLQDPSGNVVELFQPAAR